MSAISIGLCHFTTANRWVYQQTIADLPFNDNHRQTTKPILSAICVCFASCFVFVWAVVSATGLSVLWNTFSTFIFHCFYVTCVL